MLEEILELEKIIEEKTRVIEEKNQLIEYLRNEIYDKNEIIYMLKMNDE